MKNKFSIFLLILIITLFSQKTFVMYQQINLSNLAQQLNTIEQSFNKLQEAFHNTQEKFYNKLFTLKKKIENLKQQLNLKKDERIILRQNNQIINQPKTKSNQKSINKQQLSNFTNQKFQKPIIPQLNLRKLNLNKLNSNKELSIRIKNNNQKIMERSVLKEYYLSKIKDIEISHLNQNINKNLYNNKKTEIDKVKSLTRIININDDVNYILSILKNNLQTIDLKYLKYLKEKKQ